MYVIDTVRGFLPKCPLTTVEAALEQRTNYKLSEAKPSVICYLVIKRYSIPPV